MQKVPLTQGFFALVDDADFSAVSAHKWHVAKRKRSVYASRHVRQPNGNYRLQLLHQFLIPDAPGVDHRDGNGLDNRRKNLRPATSRQNHQGFQRKRKGTTSAYRGVSWNVRAGKWTAQLVFNGRPVYLGRFERESDAARAYDSAAQKYFGEFATSNF